MQCVILAGGLGTRLAELTSEMPKPMVPIDDRPILWHLMKYYSVYGINEFIICAGYKSHYIKNFFQNLAIYHNDIQIDVERNSIKVLNNSTEDRWNIIIAETGLNCMTGSRLFKIKDYVSGTFFMTYGDGLGNVDLNSLKHHHESCGTVATVTAVRPPGRFGSLVIQDDLVNQFVEKPAGDNAWINGGFFVFEKEVFNYINGSNDDCVLEQKPLQSLALDGQLSAFCHQGFWQPMDTLRDLQVLRSLISEGNAPWKIW